MYINALQSTQNSERCIQPTTFNTRNPKNKKYMFHKMITKEQKQILLRFKGRAKKKDPQYFSKMLKEQKRKMFVNTFIRKLKNSIILRQVPFQHLFTSNIMGQEQLQCIQISKNVEIIISLFLIMQITFLVGFNSLGIIFDQFVQSQFIGWYNIVSFIIHITQILMKLFIKHDYEQKNKKNIKENIKSYLSSEDIIIDLIVSLSFIIMFIFNSTQQYSIIITISQIAKLLKIKTLLICLSQIQLVLIQNQYREGLWNLVKVFMFNFVIAHFIALALIAMSRLNLQKNWVLQKQLNNSPWDQLYVWSYYWATTIMLTVGFGDICPTNKTQAMCMIFIQTMSCIVLAYNINRVGSILSKILSYDYEKNGNLKVFNQISQKSQISSQLENKITNYIKQSTLIKRNYNLEQQKNFILKLPSSFKEQLLKQMNKKIWHGMTFFQNLSQKTLLQLSKHIQKKLTHPQQIVYTRGRQIDVMIFNKGTLGLSYNNCRAKINGKIMQQIEVKQNQFKIISLDFILSKTLNYDIKCVDYMIFYKIMLSSFLDILKNISFDYEYFFMVKDKDKFLLNQFELEKCKICPNQRHNIFKCPRIHYIPLKKHIIDKSKRQNKNRTLDFSSIPFKRYKVVDHFCPTKSRKQVRQELMKIRLQIEHGYYTESMINTQQVVKSSVNEFIFKSTQKSSLLWSQHVVTHHQQRPLLARAVDQLKQGLKSIKQSSYAVGYYGVWDVECDLAHNYKFYFKQQNSQNLDKKCFKKSKLKAIRTI